MYIDALEKSYIKCDSWAGLRLKKWSWVQIYFSRQHNFTRSFAYTHTRIYREVQRKTEEHPRSPSFGPYTLAYRSKLSCFLVFYGRVHITNYLYAQIQMVQMKGLFHFSLFKGFHIYIYIYIGLCFGKKCWLEAREVVINCWIGNGPTLGWNASR